MRRGKRLTILSIVATDSTFEWVPGDFGGVWKGKCLHCRRRLVIAEDGTPLSSATIEHIVPRNHRGDNSLENLALACSRCNQEKGRRHDTRKRGDERLEATIGRLLEERRRRWRSRP